MADVSALARKIEQEVAAAQSAGAGHPDEAVRAVAAAADAAGAIAGALLGSEGLDARQRFGRLAEDGAITFDLAQRLSSLAGFETLAFRQCKTALDPTLLDVIVREELGALTEFAAFAKARA